MCYVKRAVFEVNYWSVGEFDKRTKSTVTVMSDNTKLCTKVYKLSEII